MRLVVLSLMFAAGCARGAYLRSGTGGLPPEDPVAVPKGTLATAQLRQPLSTGRSAPGDRFTMELLDPLSDAEGREVVGRGAMLEGVVREADGSKVAGDSAHLELQLLGVRNPGEGVVPVPAELASGPFSFESTWKRDAMAAAAGLAAGAGAGLAIDHDQSGVVIGSSIIGAAVGVLASNLFGSRDAELPAGSIVTLRLTKDVKVDKPVSGLYPPCPAPQPPVKAAVSETRSDAGPDAVAPGP